MKRILVTGGAGFLGSHLARQMPRWEPKTQLSEGLERTIDYFRDRLLNQQIADPATLARLGRPQSSTTEAVDETAAIQVAGSPAETA